MKYQIFNIVIESEIELPDLSSVDSGTPEISIAVGKGSQFSREAYETVHEWKLPGRASYCTVARKAGECLFSFPGFVHYLIPSSKEISCFPEEGCPPEVIRHTLVDQLIPRLLAEQGRLIIHASMVALPGGELIAFVGNSGHGKSTLAFSFYSNGARLLADDCVQLESAHGAVFARGAYSGARLWPETIQGLSADEAGFSPVTPMTSKQKAMIESIQVADESTVGPTQISQEVSGFGAADCLSAVFVLNDPSEPSGEIQIERLSGLAAVRELAPAVFCLDPLQLEFRKRSFHGVGEVLDTGLPVYTLAYPRIISELPELRASIKSIVSGSIPGVY